MGKRSFLLRTASFDVIALGLAAWAASWLVDDFGTLIPWRVDPKFRSLLVVAGGAAVLAIYLNARSWEREAPRPSYGRAISMVAMLLGITGGAILVSRMDYSRPFMAIVAAAWLGLMFAQRFAQRRRPWAESLVVVSGEKELVEALRAAPHARVVDVFSPGDLPPQQPYPEGTTLSVDLRAVLGDQMAQYVSSCHLAGKPVRAFSSSYEEHTGRLPIVHLVEGWELTVPLEAKNWYVQIKRLLDTILVLVTAPFTLPLAAVIALAVYLDSRGPVVFRQERIGRDGHAFTLYKFRTMVHQEDDLTPRFAVPADYRLTRVGKWLRRFRVDELPQLLNVLRGDVSLVGPRPEQAAFAESFGETIPFYTHRHLVRPGITGWAQINFGYADDTVDTIEKLSYDLYYIKHVSPWLDLTILGRSIWTVLSGFGAQ
jgi:exopolysaccharide biosynthesis polyprenyl glycosylphosphotransferase